MAIRIPYSSEEARSLIEKNGFEPFLTKREFTPEEAEVGQRLTKLFGELANLHAEKKG